MSVQKLRLAFGADSNTPTAPAAGGSFLTSATVRNALIAMAAGAGVGYGAQVLFGSKAGPLVWALTGATAAAVAAYIATPDTTP